jgi:mevalonate kinase
MKKVTTSAPGKLMIMGEHAVVYGNPCIVTAVDQRIYATVEANGEGEIHVCSPNVGLDEYHKSLSKLGQGDVPKSMAFVEYLIRRIYKKYKINEGIRVTTESDFSTQFGFGSSAAVVVALAQALSEYFELDLSKDEIFKHAYQAVLDVQGVGSGFDVAASVYGGTLYYVTPGKVIEQICSGELPMVVGYTGIKADTPTLVRQVAELRRQEKWVEAVFGDITDLVKRAKKLFTDNKIEQIGELLNTNQDLLATLNVSSEELNKMIKSTRKAGAWGAKLSGAGGGDCMIAFGGEEISKEIVSAIEEAGGEWMDVVTGAEGVRVEKGNMEEMLIVVDKDDEIVDHLPRSVCHSDPHPLHREIFVLLSDRRGRVWLQKRSKNKSQFPNMWTVTASGHVSKGQSYLEAAKRELMEEVGVETELTESEKFLSKRPENNAMIQSYVGVYEGEFGVDQEEVSEVRAYSKSELVEMRDELTPAARHFLRMIELLD